MTVSLFGSTSFCLELEPAWVVGEGLIELQDLLVEALSEKTCLDGLLLSQPSLVVVQDLFPRRQAEVLLQTLKAHVVGHTSSITH